MSEIALARRETSTWVASLARRLAVPLLIFGLVFVGYYVLQGYLNSLPGGELSYTEPLDWYKHHVFLTDAILHGSLDVGASGIPDFYQDTIIVGDNEYIPFPPAPAVLLLPFVAIWGTDLSQVYFSMALGAMNVVLFWYLLGLLNLSRTTKLLMVPFFAFGTVLFYSATTGTVWYYAHLSAVFFLFLAIIFLLRRAPLVVPAIFLGLAFLSREATILAAPFFAYWIVRQRHESIFSKKALLDKQSLFQMGLFAAALVPFVAFTFWYNVERFGDPLDNGFDNLYASYTSGNLITFYRSPLYGLFGDTFRDLPIFNILDIRNIPLHLYTIFLMPPDFHPDWSVFRPSPYGMSVLLTSPAFIFAVFVKRKDVLKTGSWLAIGFVSIPLLLFFAQGWVQFGYRFLLDFAPFLLILTAFGFEDNRSPTTTKLMIFLVAFSIVANVWGRYWGTELGW